MPCIELVNSINVWFFVYRPPLNLLRQELAGTCIYLDILQKTTSTVDMQKEKDIKEDKIEGIAEGKLVSFCEQVLRDASEFQSSMEETSNMDVHRVLELRSPIIIKVWVMSLISNVKVCMSLSRLLAFSFEETGSEYWCLYEYLVFVMYHALNMFLPKNPISNRLIEDSIWHQNAYIPKCFCCKDARKAAAFHFEDFYFITLQLVRFFELQVEWSWLIIFQVLKGMCEMNSRVFRSHLRDFYPLITKLVCCDQVIREPYMSFAYAVPRFHKFGI